MTRPATSQLPRLRFRPLPRTVAPLHNESQASYIERLARANRMIPLELREHLADPRRVRPGELPLPVALAQLAGQPLDRLLLALPDLATPDLADRIPPRRDRLHPGWKVQPACRLCLVAKGVRYARHWVPPGTTICPRHQRWTGAHGQQFDITALPEITHAQRRHRQMIRRHGWKPAARAMNEAASICWTWWDKQQHTGALNRRRAILPGPAWPGNQHTLTLAACAYPDIVALAELLSSPDPRALPFTGALRDQLRFITEVREHVAPAYRYGPGEFTASSDPLALGTGQERHHRTVPGPSAAAETS